jgi:hypothetical protein
MPAYVFTLLYILDLSKQKGHAVDTAWRYYTLISMMLKLTFQNFRRTGFFRLQLLRMAFVNHPVVARCHQQQQDAFLNHSTFFQVDRPVF